MPDGPPWIRTVVRKNWNLEDSFHVVLDENERWTITFNVVPEVHEHEISVNLRKPRTGLGLGCERFMVFNDHYSGAPGAPGQAHYDSYKFDNEEIYISTQWRNPGVGWTDCTPSSAQISGNNNKDLTCEFTDPKGVVVHVRVSREG